MHMPDIRPWHAIAPSAAPYALTIRRDRTAVLVPGWLWVPG